MKFRDRVRGVIFRILFGPREPVRESPQQATPAQPTVVSIDFGSIFTEDDEPIEVKRDVYLYISTIDGDTWELPLAKGTKLRFHHYRQSEQWPGFHGCGFTSEWD